jgi:hypothetical protein
MADGLAGKTIGLTFEHKLVKLVMHVTGGEGVACLEGLKVSIMNSPYSSVFNLKSGAHTIANEKRTITPKTIVEPSGETCGVYEAILLPDSQYPVNGQTGHGMNVEFTVNGHTYTWNMAPLKFTEGLKYDYNVTLNKTSAGGTTPGEGGNTPGGGGNNPGDGGSTPDEEAIEVTGEIIPWINEGEPNIGVAE